MSQGTTPEASGSFQGCERLLARQVCLTGLCFLYKMHLELRLPAAGARALVGVSRDQQGMTSGRRSEPPGGAASARNCRLKGGLHGVYAGSHRDEVVD